MAASRSVDDDAAVVAVKGAVHIGNGSAAANHRNGSKQDELLTPTLPVCVF